MNWDQIEGKWKQFTGSARERWGKITDSDWETIGGKKDQLVGRIQECYGLAQAEAEKQADEWSRAVCDPPPATPAATPHAATCQPTTAHATTRHAATCHAATRL